MDLKLKSMMAEGKIFQAYQVGDVVRTTDSFGPNRAGSIGIIYETYPDHVAGATEIVSVLLTNGHDIGSFNGEEQTESLAWLGHVAMTYTYSDPAQLMKDFRNGFFDQVFAETRIIADHVGLESVVHQ